MSKHDVTLRLSAEGRDQLIRDLRAVGGEGEKMARQIERSGQPASRGLLAVNAASREVQGGIQGAAGRAGAFGNVLRTLGPAGVAAAAGLGVMALAIGKAFQIAKEGMDFADELDTATRRLGMGVEALQEYRAALQVAGDASANFDDGARTLLERMGEMARGTGEGVKIFKTLGVDIVNARGEMKSLEVILPELSDALARVGSEAERADIANKLFGGQGLNFVALLAQGSDALERQRNEMRELGIVMDAQVVKRYAEASDKAQILSKAIDVQLKSAFVDLAPVIAQSLGLILDIARGINSVTDAITDLENKTSGNLAANLDQMVKERAQLLRDREGFAAGQTAGLGALGVTLGDDDLRAAAENRLRELDEMIERAQAELRRREARSHAQSGSSGVVTPIADPAAIANAERDAQVLANLARQIATFGDARQQAIDSAMARLSKDATPEQRAEVERLAGVIFDATQNQKELNEAIAEEQRLRTEGRAVLQSVMTDEEKFAAEKERLKSLLDAAAISAETYSRALERAGEQYIPAARAAKELSTDLARLVTNNLAAARSFDDLAGIADQALTRIMQKILEVHAMKPIEDFIGGAISSFMPGIFHSGGMAGAAGPSRQVSPAAFIGAPRYHSGGVLPGEVPIIAKRGEGIFTPRQMDNADALFRSLAMLAARPAAGGVTVRIETPAGVGMDRASARTNGEGGLDVDVLLKQVDAGLGGMIGKGNSETGRAIERRFGLDPARSLQR